MIRWRRDVLLRWVHGTRGGGRVSWGNEEQVGDKTLLMNDHDGRTGRVRSFFDTPSFLIIAARKRRDFTQKLKKEKDNSILMPEQHGDSNPSVYLTFIIPSSAGGFWGR